MATKRKTLEELIKDTKIKLKELEAKKKLKAKSGSKDLSKDSEGVPALVEALDTVAKAHKMTVPEVIKQIARIKRTGLVITNAVRKVKFNVI
jgi:hypothetical protein